MSARFVSVDRETPMLLPPDLRDWVPEDDLVHFVIEAVDRLPLEKFRVNHWGTGDAQFPPHMMLALLIYCYANGIFSSRKIERATYRDVAVRYLTAGTHPDHDTICKFRRENLEAFRESFVDVLELARELKLLKLGTVSIDGTHIKANASIDQNVTYRRAVEIREQLRLDIEELLKRAEQADAEDEDSQKLPAEVSRREKLRTGEGKAIYGKRNHTVEPVFGIIKEAMGFREFRLRGKEKVSGEWTLVCLAYNLKRLHKLFSGPKSGPSKPDSPLGCDQNASAASMRAVVARLSRAIRPHMTCSSGISPDPLALTPTVS
jgi:transposase